MALRGLFIGIVATAALVGVAVLSGCGEAPRAETVTVTTTAPGTHVATTQHKLKPRTTATASPSASRRRGTSMTSCDPNVRAKAATTTCGFAESAFYEYWLWQKYGRAPKIKAFSSALGTFLAIECQARELVTCRTPAGAVVRFPLTAVRAYTIQNAEHYAQGHKVSGGPDRPKPPSTPPSSGSQDCDPNYEGACLDPTASDYDCEGGRGDGPEYTGTVTVVGDDHFGLDRDGDGVGCQS